MDLKRCFFNNYVSWEKKTNSKDAFSDNHWFSTKILARYYTKVWSRDVLSTCHVCLVPEVSPVVAGPIMSTLFCFSPCPQSLCLKPVMKYLMHLIWIFFFARKKLLPLKWSCTFYPEMCIEQIVALLATDLVTMSHHETNLSLNYSHQLGFNWRSTVCLLCMKLVETGT